MGVSYSGAKAIIIINAVNVVMAISALRALMKR
jgi:hypothetical protein